MTKTTSQPASPAMLPATVAPRSASGCVLAAVRFQTVTGRPASTAGPPWRRPSGRCPASRCSAGAVMRSPRGCGQLHAGEQPGAGHVELVGGEPGQQLAAARGDDDLLLDPGRRRAVRGRPVGLDREHHALLQLHRMLERVVAAHQRPFPVRQAQPVAVLQAERLLLVGEAELRGGGEMPDHVGRGCPGTDLGDRVVHEFAGPAVRRALLTVRAAHVERPVVTGPVAVEGVDDVEVRGVARPDQPVGEHVRMRAAPLTGDRVDRLHLLRPVLVQVAADQGDAGVLPDARAQVPVELVVGAVHQARPSGRAARSRRRS